MTRAKDISKIVTDADLSGTLDVTGTVTADGLTVDGLGTFSSSASTPILTHESTHPSGIPLLDLKGASASQIRYVNGSTVYSRITFNDSIRSLTYDGASLKERLNIANNGDISFYEDTGTTPKLFWDASAESLGIGTSTVDSLLHLSKSDATAYSSTASDSQVGVGPTIYLENPANSNTSVGGQIVFGMRSTEAQARIGATGGASPQLVFGTNDAERMRIDSSGNLLVGKTAITVGTVGVEARENGSLIATKDGDKPLLLNRLTSDGDIAEFRIDGTARGSIGVSSTGNDLYIGNDDVGLRFSNGSNLIAPYNVTTQADSDNAIDLGYSSGRFNDAYITNGVTTGSDFNDKQNIETLSDAEVRVATACKGLLRKWKWKSAVAEKGDNARTHFGIIAQDLQDAFTAEGLDAGDYAMFMSNTWWELDGKTYETEEEAPEGATEKTRLGVRYNELLAFIISAI